MQRGWTAIWVVAAFLAWPSVSAAQVQLTPIGGDSFFAVRHVAAPPRDYERVFVVQSDGIIRLLKNDVLQPTPFLDISASVTDVGEGGLKSIAFAPDYATSGRFFVAYAFDNGATANCQASAVDADVCAPLRVEGHIRSAGDPDQAGPTARGVLTIPHEDGKDHYGGQLAFGSDSKLYLSTGDGRSGDSDANEDAQNLNSQLGKLLRLDPTVSPTAVEVWAYGLRNPWRFSFDPPTGDLFLGDNGQTSYEEIDRVPPGTPLPVDFGWNDCEGAHTYPAGEPGCTKGLAPMFEYPHVGTGCTGSVIGGLVVRDPGLESLLGRYLYADYCADAIRTVGVPPGVGDPQPVASLNNPVTFGLDGCGRIYVAQQGTLSQARPIQRLGDGTPAPCPPLAPPPGGTTDPPPVTGGSATTPDDRTPPGFFLRGMSPQRLGRRGLLVRLRCEEPCRARVSASVDMPGAARLLRFPTLRRTLAAGRSYNLRLKLARAKRRRVRRALRRGRRLRARVVARISDEAGNLAVGRSRVRLVP